MTALSRTDLAVLVPELLLAGHLIDRAAMPHVLAQLGREGMTAVAIEEWLAASPVYTKRMQRALRFEGDGVETIFKGMQIDIGAPPQFMDFRYEVFDHDHGQFHLDHCGALLDVEQMGPEYVTAMCHDIEDPTFDGTATATNPRAQCRPIHRPPRTPADRSPHCAWTVSIDADNPPAPYPRFAEELGRSAAATMVLGDIDPAEDGRADYSGPLLADLQWGEWSGSALARMAAEICLQGHLLALGAAMALGARLEPDVVRDVLRRQFAGTAGIASERLCRALRLPPTVDGLVALLAIHPALAPAAYTGITVQPGPQPIIVLPKRSAAMADGSWPALIDGDHLGPLNALVRGVDPHFSVRVEAEDDESLRVQVHTELTPHRESDDVALTRFSGGAAFDFNDRGPSLPLHVI
ncbi:hypothetical protein [Tomitella biformata]|uniref:hypothetical protein n=1 Tax=Tomitella biformata TaxID=630403 RepID=UPI0004650E22|nr:hypothetical protein [Tomitella biformata]